MHCRSRWNIGHRPLVSSAVTISLFPPSIDLDSIFGKKTAISVVFRFSFRAGRSCWILQAGGAQRNYRRSCFVDPILSPRKVAISISISMTLTALLVSIQLCLVLPPPSSSSCTCILSSTFLSQDLFSKYSLENFSAPYCARGLSFVYGCLKDTDIELLFFLFCGVCFIVFFYFMDFDRLIQLYVFRLLATVFFRATLRGARWCHTIIHYRLSVRPSVCLSVLP